MPLERKLSARRSQRRKQKVEDIVGITSKINSLAPPGHYGYDNDQNGSDLSVLGAGGSIPTTPKTPAVKRKSFRNKKSQSIASEPTGFNQPEAKQPKERTSLAPKHKAAKMDVARAMGIMGFNSSRWLDASQTGTDPKSELDKAQFQRMQDLLKRKRTAQKEAELGITNTKSTKGLTGYQKRTADRGVEKIQEDIMNLHEAYQFLMKKYQLDKKKIHMKSLGIATILGGRVDMGDGRDGSVGDDLYGGLGSIGSFGSGSASGTRLSEDLGDLNIVSGVPDTDMGVDDIFG